MELLEQIKLLVGITNSNKDNLINLLISKAVAEIERTTKREYNTDMNNLVTDIVLYKYSRLGNEGLNSISASGISESYSDKYPQYINSQLDTFKKRVKLL